MSKVEHLFAAPSPIDFYNNRSIFLRFEISNDQVRIYNSYRIKDNLKRYGFRYDPESKCWYANKVQFLTVANEIWIYLPKHIKEYCYFNGVRNKEIERIEDEYKRDEFLKELIQHKDSKVESLVNRVVETVGVLKEFQVEGIRRILKAFARGHKGFILEDQQGLGKTLQACSVIYALVTSNQVKNVIVFTNNSLVQNYVNEFIKFFAETGFMFLVTRNIEIGKVVITSYSRLLTDDYDMIRRINFDLVVLDEVQAIKNPTSKTYKNIKPVLNNARFILATSGTIVRNRPLECYNITRALNLHNMTQYQFAAKFEGHNSLVYRKGTPNKYYKKIKKENVKELRQFLTKTGLYLRRRKVDVLEYLPQKTRIMYPIYLDTDVSVELSRAIEMENEILQSLSASVKLPKDIATKINSYRRIIGIHKVDYMENLFRSLHDENRLVIFVNHVDVCKETDKLIRSIFDDVDVEIMMGDTKKKERDRIVNRFQSDADEKVWLIANLKIASEGLTLTKANKMVFTELEFTPAVFMQAEDRIHRITQEKDCTYYYAIAMSTLDQYIYNILNIKNSYLSAYYDIEEEE